MSWREMDPAEWGMDEVDGFLKEHAVGRGDSPQARRCLALWDTEIEPAVRVVWPWETGEASPARRLVGSTTRECTKLYTESDYSTWTLEELGWMWQNWARVFFPMPSLLGARQWKRLGQLALERAVAGEVAFVRVEG